MLRLIHEQPNISQAELVGQSGFSGGLVSEITQRLITKGLVAQSAPRPSSAGRKALVLKGDLYRGPGGGAGEFGHLTVVDKGPLCCCGNSGCLETVASCAAIISMVNSAIQQGVDSRIRELAEEDLDRVSIELIGEAARQNDSLAFRVFDRAVGYIGVALADVVNLLNPTLVILGGPLFRAAPYLLDPLQRVMKQHALERCANQVQLRVSQLGSEGGAMGAASAVAQMVVEDLHTESCQ